MTCQFYTDDEQAFLMDLRIRINAALRLVRNTAYVISREEFDRLEDLMGRVPMYDDERDEWYNANLRFADPRDARLHLLFKGIKVYEQTDRVRPS